MSYASRKYIVTRYDPLVDNNSMALSYEPIITNGHINMSMRDISRNYQLAKHAPIVAGGNTNIYKSFDVRASMIHINDISRNCELVPCAPFMVEGGARHTNYALKNCMAKKHGLMQDDHINANMSDASLNFNCATHDTLDSHSSMNARDSSRNCLLAYHDPLEIAGHESIKSSYAERKYKVIRHESEATGNGTNTLINIDPKTSISNRNNSNVVTTQSNQPMRSNSIYFKVSGHTPQVADCSADMTMTVLREVSSQNQIISDTSQTGILDSRANQNRTNTALNKFVYIRHDAIQAEDEKNPTTNQNQATKKGIKSEIVSKESKETDKFQCSHFQKPCRLVVLDGANIAWSHGHNREKSLKGLLIAIQWFKSFDMDVLAFLPTSYLNAYNHNPIREEMDKLIAVGSVVRTPLNDNDDLYMIQYARDHDGFIVTNDQFRDHVRTAKNIGKGDEMPLRTWINSFRISYTFVRDEFVPCPGHPLIYDLATPKSADASEKTEARKNWRNAGNAEMAVNDWLEAANSCEATLMYYLHGDMAETEKKNMEIDLRRRRGVCFERLGLFASSLKEYALIVELLGGSSPESVYLYDFAMQKYLDAIGATHPDSMKFNDILQLENNILDSGMETSLILETNVYESFAY